MWIHSPGRAVLTGRPVPSVLRRRHCGRAARPRSNREALPPPAQLLSAAWCSIPQRCASRRPSRYAMLMAVFVEHSTSDAERRPVHGGCPPAHRAHPRNRPNVSGPELLSSSGSSFRQVCQIQTAHHRRCSGILIVAAVITPLPSWESCPSLTSLMEVDGAELVDQKREDV